jgi:hypothetical protein
MPNTVNELQDCASSQDPGISLASQTQRLVNGVTGKVGNKTATLGASVMEFQGGKDQPNGCNREKKPEHNHAR